MYFYCLNKTNSRTTFGNYDYFQFILVSAFLPMEIPECPNYQRFSKNRDIDLKTAVKLNVLEFQETNISITVTQAGIKL